MTKLCVPAAFGVPLMRAVVLLVCCRLNPAGKLPLITFQLP